MRSKAAIFGASGYAGGELLRLLLDHPKAEPVAVISRSQAGQPVAAVHTHLSRLTDLRLHERAARGRTTSRRSSFSRAPTGTPSTTAPPLLDTGDPGVDLSADFRLKDPESFERFYGPVPPGFARQKEFVYGLPELFREQIAAVAGRRLARLLRDGDDPRRSRRSGAPASWTTRRPFPCSPSRAPPGAGVTPTATTHHPRRASRVLRLRDRRPPASSGDRGVALGDRRARRRPHRVPDALGAARARHLRHGGRAAEAPADGRQR